MPEVNPHKHDDVNVWSDRWGWLVKWCSRCGRVSVNGYGEYEVGNKNPVFEGEKR